MPSSHLASFIDEFALTGPVEIDPGKVLAALADLQDPRKKRGVRHRFAHLLVIMVCSVVAGATSLVEMAEWTADTARDQLAALGIGSPLDNIFQGPPAPGRRHPGPVGRVVGTRNDSGDGDSH
ncbi:transposase family protein [Arthrobacter psychrochitiniphilus]|uniref:transposase family protein n=1 Tax=Arthrobacter psychrochitiniphilus TaxID=291045 RepID=UPI003F7B37C2